MTTVGGALEEMGRLGQVFRENGAQIEQIRGTIDGVLSSTTWTGPAADRFRDQWAQFSPSLVRLNEALAEAGAEVDRRRDALDAATR